MRYAALSLTIAGLMFSPVSAQEDAGTETSFEARVLSIEEGPCSFEGTTCSHVVLSPRSGEWRNEEITAEISSLDAVADRMPEIGEGDLVIVQAQSVDGIAHFFISDVVRRNPLFLLLALFIVCVVALSRAAGARSLIGMLCTFAILFGFILPRILAGNPPLLIAIIGSLLIMGLTFLIGHGWNSKTRAAWAGTSASLLLTGVLALVFSALARLTGFADEETLFLISAYPDIDTKGILLAGILIGSLGVLDDIAISQASAVLELKHANPRLNAHELYRRGLRIGSDHIAAAVNTLILAYAGSALPLLLLLASGGTGESWWTFLNREIIAAEIVRTLVGSIGLLAAVPCTTWIASRLAHDDADIKMANRGHHHGF